jgi:tRNA-(ms[2]io[6]A)-hydroxylase
MLMFRERIPAGWADRMQLRLAGVLVDHAHLERKAATTAITLERYRDLYGRVRELNAIAMEELQHFEQVLGLLERRGIPFGQPVRSPWISGLMGAVRVGNNREQVIDHLLCCALIEGRSCEKFQLLGRALAGVDDELAAFYAGLVESEGNHYATYLLMARHLDEGETDRRLDWFLDFEAGLMREPHDLAILH